ncbi:MAG: elongator complex protein 3 [Eubacteriales bacterium]|jgi:histone acetyltransferase (RNA polymerase elongator complex component)
MKPRRSIIPIFIPHLGCPCRCVFCNQHSITSVDDHNTLNDTALTAQICTDKSHNIDRPASKVRTQNIMPDPSEIGMLIEEGIKKSGKGAELAFYGGSFTAICPDLRRSYLEAAHPYVSRELIKGIRISTRPDAIDDDILHQLWYFGVRTIELGAQSMDDQVLQLSKRGHTAADTVNAARLVRQMGFSLILQMMVGLPGETADSPMSTARQLAALQPDGVRIYPTAVLGGTELELMWKKGGYSPLSFEQAVDICADLISFFDSRGISILRVGLNPSEDLSGEILAGIYHPAFGDYCRSRLVYRATRQLLSDIMEDGYIRAGAIAVFRIDRKHLSLFVGQHRYNIKKLMDDFELDGISVLDEDSVSVTNYRKRMNGADKIYSFASTFNADEMLSVDGWTPVNNKELVVGSQVVVEFLGIY